VVWLRSLGLGKYEAAFRENEIDETVLPNLTAEDLKELGVASLGHRRKLSMLSRRCVATETQAQRLAPASRSTACAFLAALAHRMGGEEIGDGTVGRAIRDSRNTASYCVGS
jgi:SAM domain (Sterile alpha motif)